MIDIRDDIGNRYTKGVFYDPFLRFPLNHPKFQQHGIHFYVIDLNMLDLHIFKMLSMLGTLSLVSIK